MSLLNDVLKDLDRRGAPRAAGSPLAGLRTAPRPRSVKAPTRRTSLLALLIVFGLSAGLGALNTHSMLEARRRVAEAKTAPPRSVEPRTAAGSGGTAIGGAAGAVELSHANHALPAVSAAPPPRAPGAELERISGADLAADAATMEIPSDRADPTPEPEARSASVALRKMERPVSRRELAEWAHVDGLALASHGEIEGATEVLKRGLEIDSSRSAIRENLAALLLRAGRIDEARAIVDAGVALDPGNASLVIMAARLRAEAGDEVGAIRLLESADPGAGVPAEYPALLAALHQRGGRHERAVPLYRDALRRAPGQSRWWMGLGISLEAIGRSSAAHDAYVAALDTRQLRGESQRFVASRARELEPPAVSAEPTSDKEGR